MLSSKRQKLLLPLQHFAKLFSFFFSLPLDCVKRSAVRLILLVYSFGSKPTCAKTSRGWCSIGNRLYPLA